MFFAKASILYLFRQLCKSIYSSWHVERISIIRFTVSNVNWSFLARYILFRFRLFIFQLSTKCWHCLSTNKMLTKNCKHCIFYFIFSISFFVTFNFSVILSNDKMLRFISSCLVVCWCKSILLFFSLCCMC